MTSAGGGWLRRLLRRRPVSGTPSRPSATGTRTSGPRNATGAAGPRAYPGDFTGVPEVVYAPQPDGEPDPGEIVWTWVPYEEDHRQGKDRPVLLIARDGRWLLGLMLTSKDHDRDARDEAAHGRQWQDIGAGAWDRQGRPSEVRVDRVIRVDPRAVRREGAVLDAARFDQVAASVRRRR